MTYRQRHENRLLTFSHKDTNSAANNTTPNLSLFLSLVFLCLYCVRILFLEQRRGKQRQRKSLLVIIKQRIRKPEGNFELWFMNCEFPWSIHTWYNLECKLLLADAADYVTAAE